MSEIRASGTQIAVWRGWTTYAEALEVKTTTLAIAAVALIGLTACKKNNETTTADTTAVPGTDTASVQAVVPTTDTVVKQTTTTTDTIKGAASSTVPAKKKTVKKPGY
jgi:uncharacterized lipoprotein YehR (DUF1307 family)